MNKVTTQLAQVTTHLQDKQEYGSQVKSHLKEYKEKHLSLEQKTEELEGQIKLCIKETEFRHIFCSCSNVIDDSDGI